MTQTAQMHNSFKETEIGEIPAEWETRPLNQVVTFTSKPRGLTLSEYEQVPFIPMELIPDNGLVVQQYELKRGAEIRSGTYFEVGDVLLSKITPSFENGKQGIPQDLPLPFGYATTEVYPLRAKSDILDQLFLFYFFRLPNVRTDIANKMEGTTGRQRVPKAVIETYLIPLPPLDEQRRIAAALSAIQQAIAAQADVIAAARELKRSLMHRLFTYGPGREPAETKETEIGEIPVHWEVRQIGHIASVQGGYAFKSTDYVKRGLRLFRISNVSFGKTTWHDTTFLPVAFHERYSSYVLHANDIVMAMTRPVVSGGIKVARLSSSETPCLLNQRVCRFVPNHLVDSGYLYHVLFHNIVLDGVTDAAGGSQQPNISANQIESICIPLAPYVEQYKIAHTIDAIDRKIAAEEGRKAALQALFRSTLHSLMTGQVRLLNDEVK